MTATLPAPLLDIDVAFMVQPTAPSSGQSPSGAVEEVVECKCKLSAFGRCPTQLVPRPA